jgi:hypothetical protein
MTATKKKTRRASSSKQPAAGGSPTRRRSGRAFALGAASGGTPPERVGEVVQTYVDSGVAEVTASRLPDGTYQISRRL